MSISKSEFAWIGIRLFGVYFLCQALAEVVELAVAIYSVYGQTEVAWGVNTDQRWDTVMAVGTRLGAFVVLYAALSFYFLAKGKYLHDFLIKASGESET